jgi:hypothetical protein
VLGWGLWEWSSCGVANAPDRNGGLKPLWFQLQSVYMKSVLTKFALLSIGLPACVQWWSDVEDFDQDGFSIADGDCHDKNPDQHPNVDEIWYDGIDQNCDGNDLDKDFDGHLSAAYGGVDCWDDPTRSDLPLEYTTLPGFETVLAGDVYPGATETYYDGVDQNCDGLNDFDQDADGYRTAFYPDYGGNFGNDCVDGADLDLENPAGLPPEEIFPGATEIWYDGTNSDCSDEAVWGDYDADGDGYPSGHHGEWEDIAEDCDDTDAARFPDFTIVDEPYDCFDADCDGTDGDLDYDGYVAVDYETQCPNWNDYEFFRHKDVGDCWDEPAEIPDGFGVLNGFVQLAANEVNPGVADQYYDGIDANCDSVDEFDQDLDGHATSAYPNQNGVVGGDCEDENPAVNPDQIEDCITSSDDDCNGTANEINAVNCSVYYNDGDSDGYGSNASLCLCDILNDWTASVSGDCDDAVATTNPGADEYCDGADNDCDSDVDEADAVDVQTFFKDADYDSFGDPNTSEQVCYIRPGFSTNGDDCDDSNIAINPNASELCDGVDNDCDGDTDENDAIDALVWYIDGDGDGYGSSDGIAIECDQPSGYLDNDSDCDDSDANINPTASEVANESDENCDDRIDEGLRSFGDFFLTEISARGNGGGADGDGEWFEIYNPGTSDLYLDGVEIAVGVQSFVLGVDGVVLPAGDYAVLCFDDTILGSACDYVYGSDNNGSSLAGATYNSSFWIQESIANLEFSLDGVLMDDLDILSGSGGWKVHESDVSLVLHSGYYGANSNDTATNWCYPGSSETFGNGGLGTGNPGWAMGTCNATFPNGN